jgi:hypothetical protein
MFDWPMSRKRWTILLGRKLGRLGAHGAGQQAGGKDEGTAEKRGWDH